MGRGEPQGSLGQSGPVGALRLGTLLLRSPAENDTERHVQNKNFPLCCWSLIGRSSRWWAFFVDTCVGRRRTTEFQSRGSLGPLVQPSWDGETYLYVLPRPRLPEQ